MKAPLLFVLAGLVCFCNGAYAGAAWAQEPAEPALLGRSQDDFGGMVTRRLVRIIVPFSKTIYFIDKGQQFGTAVEFGTALETALNKGRKKEIEKIRIAFVPLGRDRLLPALREGLGDIVMANLTITDARSASVDFTEPLFGEAEEILVTSPSAPSIKTIEDLSGKAVFVRATSSYREHLETLNTALEKAGRPPARIVAIDENLEDEDILEMINADLLGLTVIDKYKATAWSQVFTAMKVRDDIAISQHGQIAWAIRKNSPELKAVLNAFVKDHRIGTTFGNMMRNRYYKSDKMLKSAYAMQDMARFNTLLAAFRKHGTTYSFDHLMLIAQGYQESQLDQSRRSKRGAVGIMQLLPSTAADKAVNIRDIDRDPDLNIEAGAKYLRHIIDTYVDGEGVTQKDRLLLGFAAYNAGPTNLRKFRAKATSMGLDPDRWFGNVENGAAAIVGRETVQYVGNIYKYYVAYSLLAERTRSDSASADDLKPAGEPLK